MRTILFLMSLLLSVGGYAGQKYEVKGKVTDATTKLALSAVVVTNVQTKKSTSTDRDGNYHIQRKQGRQSWNSAISVILPSVSR